MSEKINGGPAFPRLETSSADRDDVTHYFSADGMTLRDYFAAKAMESILANPETLEFAKKVLDVYEIGRAEWIAEQSYLFADAMLKAREA